MNLRLVAFALGLTTTTLHAQRTWLDPIPDNSVGLSLGSAVFRDGVTTFPTATMALRGRVAIGNDLVLTLELPRGHASQQSGLSGAALGLPWLGFELRLTPWAIIEFGGRTSLDSPATQREILPFAYGPSLDFVRQEAWAPGASAVRAGGQLGALPSAGSLTTLRLGVTGINSSTHYGAGQLFVNYAGRAGLARPDWLGWIGVLGNLRVVESGGSLGDRSAHQLEIGVSSRGRRQQFGLSLRRFVGESFGSTMPLIVRVEATLRGG